MNIPYFPALLLLPLFSLILISCSASTASRYQKPDLPAKQDQVQPDSVNNGNSDDEVNFDMSRYHSRLDIKESRPGPDSLANSIWYGYEKTDSASGVIKTVISKAAGFRVQIISTDNLDEANDVRTETRFKTSIENIYVIFDPPFYKVRAGDFLSQSEANQLKFRLNQMGYNECRVVKDSVNIY